MAQVVSGAKAAAVAKKEDKAKAMAAAKEAKEKAAKEKEMAAKKADRDKAADNVKAAKADATAAKKKLKEEKAAIAAKKKEDAKAAKEAAAAAKVKEPDWVEQKSEKGKAELTNKNKFPYEVSCAYPDCSEVRFVNRSGLLLTTMCKPHARKERRKRRMATKRAKMGSYKLIIDAALKQGYFPEAFKKKHALT